MVIFVDVEFKES